MPCSTCDARSCIRGGEYPEICTTNLCSSNKRNESLELYTTPEYFNVVRSAYKTILSSRSAKWPRVQEIIFFARNAGFSRIGIASCISFAHETKLLAALLRNEGFEVIDAMCKMGGLRKSDIGLLEDGQSDGPLCNPIMQADALNQAGTELNLVVGLCLGYDMVFNRCSEAFCTTLAVKDQSLGVSAHFREALEAWQQEATRRASSAL